MTNTKRKKLESQYIKGSESANKERFIAKKVCRNLLTLFSCPKMPSSMLIISVHKYYDYHLTQKKSAMVERERFFVNCFYIPLYTHRFRWEYRK